MIISFAWTTDALLAGRKTCTRRDWRKEYAARFREGTVHDAYDRLPRVHGKWIGNVEIIRTPYPEWTRDIPDADYEAEGFAYMEEKGLLIRGQEPRVFFENWRASAQLLFVVRLALVFPCDRCGLFTQDGPFGPKNDKRLCPRCWVDWTYFADRDQPSEEAWQNCYDGFLVSEVRAAPKPRKGR